MKPLDFWLKWLLGVPGWYKQIVLTCDLLYDIHFFNGCR